MAFRIMITGANGQLGRALNIELGGDPDIEIVNTDVGQEKIRSLDITNVDAVLSFAREIKPYAIINCAAHTAVDKCETDLDNAYRINAVGPRNLSIAASETGAKLIHISTDYVFDGTATKPYIEFDRPNPQGAYGKTKLAGEEMVRGFARNYMIFRTAWLYGDGKNFVKTMLRLSGERDEVSVVYDQVGSPTSARELARAIRTNLFTDNYGLFHATCEGDTNWADFTKEIYRLAGRDTKVKPITAAEFGAAAPRPAYSILDNYMLRLTGGYRFADWHDALEEYMKEFQS